MNETITLELTARPQTGGGSAYQLRKAGVIPGIVYGPTIKTPITVASQSINALVKAYKAAGKTKFITVQSTDMSELNGQKLRFKDIQVDHLKNTVTHFDMHLLDLNTAVRTVVPLKFVGKAKGTTEGGLLNILVRNVEVKCLPSDTPEFIEADVSHLGLNETMHVSDLAESNKGAKFTILFTDDLGLANVSVPREEAVTPQVAAAADAAAAAAPAADAAKKAEPKKDAKK